MLQGGHLVGATPTSSNFRSTLLRTCLPTGSIKPRLVGMPTALAFLLLLLQWHLALLCSSTTKRAMAMQCCYKVCVSGINVRQAAQCMRAAYPLEL